jgi:hypothetical protein
MRYIVALICILSFQISFAQKDCVQVLSEAQTEFNAGHFYGLSSLLKECLETNGFTREQKVTAYRLLAQAYLVTDDPLGAESSYLRLLQADPEYISEENTDPVDIFYLSKKFTATPKFTPTLFRAGVNVSFARLIHRVNTNSLPGTKYKQNVKAGFQVGSGVDWNINDNISIAGELNFSYKSFMNVASGIFDDSNGGSDEQSVTEKQSWFDLPIYAKYTRSKGTVRPFGYIGFSFNLLLSDKAQIDYLNRTPGISLPGEAKASAVVNPTQGPDVNLLFKRNALNRSLVLGGGIRYKFGKDFLVLDLRYMGGLTNVTNKNRIFYENKNTNDFTMNEEVAKYSFVSDYFRVDNLSFSIGYVKPLYNPRKIKRARTNSAMKKKSNAKKENEK